MTRNRTRLIAGMLLVASLTMNPLQADAKRRQGKPAGPKGPKSCASGIATKVDGVWICRKRNPKPGQAGGPAKPPVIKTPGSGNTPTVPKS